MIRSLFAAFRRPAAPFPVSTIEAVAPKAASKNKGRFVAGTAFAALCCTTITGFEGMRTTAYRDSVGVPTVCIGETKGVRMGQRFTVAQCQAMLVERLGRDYAPAIERCVKRDMGDDFYVAALSLSYNIGTGGFCRSSIVRLYNAGDRRAACNAFLSYDKAKGRVLSGLVKRRQAERALCLKGV
jgi:lysozyme